MADFLTFADLQNRVRDDIADHTDTFYSPTEFRTALNEAQWEIFKIVHADNRGFFFNTTPETISLLTTTNYYPLTNEFAWVDQIMPTNDTDRDKVFFYKSRHDQDFRSMLATPTDQSFSNPDQYFYDVVGNKTLVIVPRPTATLSVDVFTIQELAELSADGDIPALKLQWRPLQVAYAVRKLKGKEETGEYMSNEKLVGFLFENLAKYTGPRGGTNQLTVEAYEPY